MTAVKRQENDSDKATENDSPCPDTRVRALSLECRRLRRLSEDCAGGTPRSSHDDDPDDTEDCSVVGAYLAEFKEGLSRDELAEALDWTLVRVHRALAARGRADSSSSPRSLNPSFL